MLVEDQNMLSSKMDGSPYKAGEFSHSLRTNIFQEHFGLSYDEVKDPLSDKFLETILKNTEVDFHQNLYL
jgi:phospholipase D1/2